MKIRLGELKRIIREVINQDTGMLGKPLAGDVGPFSPMSRSMLGHEGRDGLDSEEVFGLEEEDKDETT